MQQKFAFSSLHRLAIAGLLGTAILGLIPGVSQASPLEKIWYEAGEHPVADIALPTIILKNGKLTGSDSCNQLIGSYELRGKTSIRFKFASTKMACPNMIAADAFSAALSKARRYEIRDGFLILFNTLGKPLLKLTAINM